MIKQHKGNPALLRLRDYYIFNSQLNSSSTRTWTTGSLEWGRYPTQFRSVWFGCAAIWRAQLLTSQLSPNSLRVQSLRCASSAH